MSIWEYADDPIETSREICDEVTCIFCRLPLTIARRTDREARPGELGGDSTRVGVCQNCGWWAALRLDITRHDVADSAYYSYGAYGVLRSLDLADISTPLQEVRDYLTVRYERRFDIHPRLFEETVASVFSDYGYSAEVTAYTRDGGVDVILQATDRRIGVQVKRYRNAIEAEQVRSFLGALVTNNLTRGMFVTTSRFRSGANDVAEQSSMRGYQIELVDAPRFYEALQVVQGKVSRSPQEWLELVRPRLRFLGRHIRAQPYYRK